MTTVLEQHFLERVPILLQAIATELSELNKTLKANAVPANPDNTQAGHKD